MSTQPLLADEEDAPPRRPRPASAIDYAVDIVNLSKRFRRKTLGRNSYTTLKTALLRSMFRRAETTAANYTTVLKDLTLRIPLGSSVGVIGRNGAGKSTFLKLITGIYKPDSGRIAVNGRLAALIELGAGFHPDFTGRENLYLAGIMHGLTRRQIDDRFDDIVGFAELAHVIDDPVRTYSSGMFMRLGFSLAVHTDPDILLVDEVLAVGDAAFAAKCKEQIARLRREGKTLLLVTHDLDAVERWCDEALWLEAGEVKDRGDPRRVIDHYRQFVERGEEETLLAEETEQVAQPTTGTSSVEAPQSQRWGSREVEITSLTLRDSSNAERRLFHPSDDMRIELEYRINEPTDDIVFGFAITRSDGVVVHGTNTDIERIELPSLGKAGRVCYSIREIRALDGEYWVDAAIHRKDGYPYDYHKCAAHFVVRSPVRQVGVYLPNHEWRIEVAS